MLELEIKAQKAISMQEHWLNEMHAHDLYEEIYHNIKNNQSIIFDITCHGDIGYALTQYLISEKFREKDKTEDAFALTYLMLSKGIFDNPSNKILYKQKLLLEYHLKSLFSSFIEAYAEVGKHDIQEIEIRVKLADYYIDYFYFEQEADLDSEFKDLVNQLPIDELLDCVKQGKKYHLDLYRNVVDAIVYNRKTLNL